MIIFFIQHVERGYFLEAAPEIRVEGVLVALWAALRASLC